MTSNEEKEALSGVAKHDVVRAFQRWWGSEMSEVWGTLTKA